MAKKRVKLFLAGHRLFYAVLKPAPRKISCWICGGTCCVKVILGNGDINIDVPCPACQDKDGIPRGEIDDVDHYVAGCSEIEINSAELSLDKSGKPVAIYKDANGNDLDPECLFKTKDEATSYASHVLEPNWEGSAAARRQSQFQKNVIAISNAAWSKSEKKP